jgi:hypothetical protein
MVGRRQVALLVAVVVMTAIAAHPIASRRQESPRRQVTSVWDGVYTAGQAERGSATYATTCARCHRTDLSGDEGLTLNGENFMTLGPSLKGATFFADWGDDTLSRLFLKIRDTMPPSFQAIVDDRAKVDVLAYILSENGFPAGSRELDLDMGRFETIQIVRKGTEGAPVPSFSVVQIVGCLTGTEGQWLLTNTTEPVLSRDGASTPSDLKRAESEPLGNGRFLLINARKFEPGSHQGQKMEAKGLLYKQAGEENRITLSSLQMVASGCAN